ADRLYRILLAADVARAKQHHAYRKHAYDKARVWRHSFSITTTGYIDASALRHGVRPPGCACWFSLTARNSTAVPVRTAGATPRARLPGPPFLPNVRPVPTRRSLPPW